MYSAYEYTLYSGFWVNSGLKNKIQILFVHSEHQIHSWPLSCARASVLSHFQQSSCFPTAQEHSMPNKSGLCQLPVPTGVSEEAMQGCRVGQETLGQPTHGHVPHQILFLTAWFEA